MARPTKLQQFISSVAQQAGRTITTSEKALLTRAFNLGPEHMKQASLTVVTRHRKKPVGQRAAYDDLNKQAQKQSSEELVDSRSALYGTFCGRADLTVDLMERLQKHPKWPAIPSWGKWALTMLVEKIGRIVEGDPSYDDNWKDIGGYAELARRNSVGEKA